MADKKYHIVGFIERLKILWRETRREANQRIRQRVLFDIAYAFNRVHAYNVRPAAACRWMCPTCNAVHKPVEVSMFSGLQYPRCCQFDEGHRLYKEAAVDYTNSELPWDDTNV